jgi:hypothetical protein
VICRLSPDPSPSTTDTTKSTSQNDDPFSVPAIPKVAGQDEPSKDDIAKGQPEESTFHGKYVHGMAWHTAEVR